MILMISPDFSLRVAEYYAIITVTVVVSSSLNVAQHES